MCTCANCEYTDQHSGLPDLFGELEVPDITRRDKRAIPGFAAWPRGKPAGKSSDRDYQAHVRYGKQWGKGRYPEASYTVRATRREDPHAHYKFEGSEYMDGYTKRYVKLPETTAEYAAEWCRLNGLTVAKEASPDRSEPARPRTPGKAREHFPEQDRPLETATIYAMPKSKPKRSRGRPAIPGRFVVVKLEERLITKAEKIGGKVAAGIREALERVKVR